MEKKSQRFPVQFEKDQSGCMWGFISIFDFRHGRFTRKLIADKRHNRKHSVDDVPTNNKFEMLSNLDEEYQDNFDRGESKRLTVTTVTDKPSVKKLIEEEMFIDQDEIKDQGNAEVESWQLRLRREDSKQKDYKRKKKSRKKSRDMDTHDTNATLKSEFSLNQHSKQQSRDNLDLDKIMEDFCHIEAACSMMHDNDGKVHEQSNQKHVISEDLARDAIHEFVNQMVLKGKDLVEDRKFLCSHELMEALQVISSDKELFLRLLQDPNSNLPKYIQELENAQGRIDKEHSSVTGSNFTEQDLGNLKQATDVVNRKHHYFFRKKVKPPSKGPTNKNGKTEISNRIVILKPAQMGMQNSESENNLVSSLDSHDIVHYKGPSARGTSHFSLTEIKKKLKHAMGKERHGNPELPAKLQNKGKGGKAIGKDNVGMRSPNKDHFFMEKIARPMFDVMRGNKTGTSKNFEFNMEHESGTPKERVSSIYIEAKKHLCEMLDNGDESTDISNRKIPKTLGRILSLPEYNFSPLGSPGRNLEHHFVTAHARFSISDKTCEVNEDNLSPKQETSIGHLDQETNNSEKHSSICDESSNNKLPEIKSESTFSHDLDHVDKSKACCPVRDEIVTEGNLESKEEINVLESSSDPNGFITVKDQNHYISQIPDGTRCSECLNPDVTEENQPSPSSQLLSPSHSSVTKKIEELESSTDVSGRPSPVSVLDIPFSDDDLGSGHSRCQPVKLVVQPRQIQFEEHDSSPVDQFDRENCCLEENELIYDYVSAVLLASGLTRDQLLMKCLSSDKILDSSLFDRVQFFTNQLCHDPKLLFDCIDEVLMEICWHYFGVSPWLSFVNPSIRSAPSMKKLILMVWEGVRWHVLPLPPPHTLEQIVRKDMARNGTWMDLRGDAETVGFEMGEAILAELMEDTILSLESESTESECSLLQSELKDNESSINL